MTKKERVKELVKAVAYINSFEKTMEEIKNRMKKNKEYIASKKMEIDSYISSLNELYGIIKR